MLSGKKLGAAIAAAIALKGIRNADLARHFHVKPPSVQGWIKEGTISKEKLPELWAFFAGVVGPAHWGLQAFPEGEDAVAATYSPIRQPTIEEATEVLAEMIAGIDEIGREVVHSLLTSLVRSPDKAAQIAKSLAGAADTHRLPPRRPTKAPAKQTATAQARRGATPAKLEVHPGGGQRSQLALPLRRTVVDPFNDKAPANEREWYKKLPAAPRARARAKR